MVLSDDATKRYERLCQSYRTSLYVRLNEIETLWATATDEQWSGESVQTLAALLHQLAGSGGAFGFPEITDAARYAKTCLEAVSTQKGGSSSEQTLSLQQSLKAICAVLTRCIQQPHTQQPPPLPSTAPAAPVVKPGDPNLLYLVEDDGFQAERLAQQLHAYGYKVQIFTELSSFEESTSSTVPAAVIMDVIFPEGTSAGIEAIRKLKQRLVKMPPVIFTSARIELQVRLDALHAGGTAYFAKPFNVEELVDRLDEALMTRAHEDYRILIVDDDENMAEFYKQTLEDVGMQTVVVTNPMQIMEPLVEFRPELVLMDLYMPSCSGLDLAAALRQEATYAHLPIVFMSQERDPEKRLACLGVGADDYLTKPVLPNYLARLVVARVRRDRRLQQMIARDSLTGLLNRSAFMERFEAILGMMLRDPGKLVVAMIDLDRFKKVNDCHGHLAGDIALKNIARQLLRRVRRTDILGRYGGEEFALVMINADAHAARLRMDGIREDIGQIHHRINNRVFHVTFSVGIASYDYTDQASKSSLTPDMHQLLNMADRALYRAKQKGGNQIWSVDEDE